MIKNIKFKTRWIVTVCLFFVINFISSQETYIYDDSINVVKNSEQIDLPWAGGLNHPQFSKMDINFDGVEELIAYEPENNLFHVFKIIDDNGVIKYPYIYNGQRFFPNDISERVLLVDYDQDGRRDLFTFAEGNGIKVYRNISTEADGIKWELVADPIYSEKNGVDELLFVNHNEMPAYVDVDGDGDLDILTFHFGLKSVDFHKNMSMETYGIPDSLLFVVKSECWGGFMERGHNNDIELNSTTYPCGTNPIPPFTGYEGHEVKARHQGGGSLLIFDYDGDGLMDALVGDVDYNNMTIIINGGHDSNDIPLMTSFDNQFPNYDTPLDLSNFLTAYFEDVDLDGVKDLIVSTSYIGLSDNTSSVWLYKNTGTNEHPIFELQTKSFLQESMIENGNNSIPIFVDINNDGLTDLLVANQYNFNDAGNTTRVNYYRNIGSEEDPVFELFNNDWNGFSISGLPTKVVPTFGDLDGDGDLDMIVGVSNGKLFYYENGGGSGAMNFNISQVLLQNHVGDEIFVTAFAIPVLYDFDNDGLLDLVVAQGAGPLLYFKNVGTAQNFAFQLMNSNFGNIDFTFGQYTSTICYPHFYEEDGETTLLLGMRDGKIRKYQSIDDNLTSGTFSLSDNIFAGIDVKSGAAPMLNDIKNNGSPMLFVGMGTGGIWSFSLGIDSTASIIEEDLYMNHEELVIYPNPVSNSFQIKSTESINEVAIYSIAGQKLETWKGQKKYNVLGYPEGIYFVKINTAKREKTIKIVIQ
ncbi:MAG: T9SS type A sorting domain-containing protein [Brumimicrobium sp.]